MSQDNDSQSDPWVPLTRRELRARGYFDDPQPRRFKDSAPSQQEDSAASPDEVASTLAPDDSSAPFDIEQFEQAEPPLTRRERLNQELQRQAALEAEHGALSSTSAELDQPATAASAATAAPVAEQAVPPAEPAAPSSNIDPELTLTNPAEPAGGARTAPRVVELPEPVSANTHQGLQQAGEQHSAPADFEDEHDVDQNALDAELNERQSFLAQPISQEIPAPVPAAQEFHDPTPSGSHPHPEYEYIHEDELHHKDDDDDFEDPVSAKKRKVRQASISVWFSLLFLGLLGFLLPTLGIPIGFTGPDDYPGPGSGEVQITVEEGEPSLQIASKLQEAGVIAKSDVFLETLVQNANGRAIQPGTYAMKKEMKSSDAVEFLFNEGNKVTYFALDAGLRVSQSLERISQGAGISMEDLNSLNANPGQFGLPENARSLEGYLAPGEYRFDQETEPKEIIQKLVDTTKERLNELGVSEPGEQQKLLTFASIVQAEGNPTDYKIIAGALQNRLKGDNPETGGRIESDATVTYGLGKISVELSSEEKQDASNPYNTFANTGLPVGPISSPGKQVLEAAANPDSNEYLYWVTVNLDTGETLFAKTYAEHQENVQQYQQWCRENEGKCK